MDHIKNARNYRKISGQHIFAEGLNPLCGDRFEIFLVKQNEHIHDVSYQCECCGISMASASIMTEILKNKSTMLLLVWVVILPTVHPKPLLII